MVEHLFCLCVDGGTGMFILENEFTMLPGFNMI